ncbi:flagellar hook-associated protein FlgK [Ferrimicrobium sp.]|uniref:flagellar hook-associated protein FlgK n=1 Tax=Ferrimicrobium sp. TaxID=2926050 RepID=UPI002638C995|nr:flagellar hook-associated protein FlgK [Ferrimicrobium sp.]
MSGGSLSIALSGLDAAQTGLDTVSENISNANTPGYLKETASFANQQTPGDPIGNGVTVTGILQSSNSFNRQLELSANGSQSYANQMQSLLTSAQASFNEPSSNGIAEQMNTMFNDFSNVADTPSQPAAYLQLQASAQNVATAIHQAAANLTATYNQASTAATTLVGTINSQLQQVASINTQLASTSLTPGASNTLVDQQNQVIDKLASELGVTSIPGHAGQTTLLIGGVALVQGGQASQITFTPGSGLATGSTTGDATVTLASSGTSVPVSSGTLGATLAALNSNLPKYMNSLNQLASSLVVRVNNSTSNGGSSTTGLTTPLFGYGQGASFSAPTTPTTSAQVNASTFMVNPQFASSYLASGTSSLAGDGTTFQQIANLQTATTGPTGEWATSVAQAGLDVQNATANATNATNVYNQAYSAEQSVSGVSVNSQLVNLVNYQQQYQAAAKVISTVAATLQSLIQDV